jgi:hypothetical protein
VKARQRANTKVAFPSQVSGNDAWAAIDAAVGRSGDQGVSSAKLRWAAQVCGHSLERARLFSLLRGHRCPRAAHPCAPCLQLPLVGRLGAVGAIKHWGSTSREDALPFSFKFFLRECCAGQKGPSRLLDLWCHSLKRLVEPRVCVCVCVCVCLGYQTTSRLTASPHLAADYGHESVPVVCWNGAAAKWHAAISVLTPGRLIVIHGYRVKVRHHLSA